MEPAADDELEHGQPAKEDHNSTEDKESEDSHVKLADEQP
jgi:hypothetical protein